MSELLDYINLMTYDYHGWFPKHTFTGDIINWIDPFSMNTVL